MGKCNKGFAARLVAELMGCMLVQYLGCAVGSKSSGISKIFNMFATTEAPKVLDEKTGPLSYAFTWGGLIIAGTMAFRIVSGAHLNPIVSVAAIIVKNIKLVDGLFYMLMQLAGSCLGYCLANASFGTWTFGSFCVTVVSVNPWWKALVVEFLLSGAWVLAFCSSWHEENDQPDEIASLKIGLVVVCATLVGTQYSNTCMNPFRSLWPALFHSRFDYIYIYVAIPFAAAIALAFAWRYLYLLNADETTSGPGGPEKE